MTVSTSQPFAARFWISCSLIRFIIFSNDLLLSSDFIVVFNNLSKQRSLWVNFKSSKPLGTVKFKNTCSDYQFISLTIKIISAMLLFGTRSCEYGFIKSICYEQSCVQTEDKLLSFGLFLDIWGLIFIGKGNMLKGCLTGRCLIATCSIIGFRGWSWWETVHQSIGLCPAMMSTMCIHCLIVKAEFYRSILEFHKYPDLFWDSLWENGEFFILQTYSLQKINLGSRKD